MSNLPPGTWEGDPRAPWNAPDHSHDHEWYPMDGLDPIFEDGAAIFHEQCEYAEGQWGEGWECEESRYYRFEYDTLETQAGKCIDLPTISEWDNVSPEIEEMVMHVEEALVNGHDGVVVKVDPDPDDGEVSVEYDDYVLTYAPDDD